ncbi:hypothetical protein PFISCL1PPCAC_3891, partial [Pristionchus fissidentatus]
NHNTKHLFKNPFRCELCGDRVIRSACEMLMHVIGNLHNWKLFIGRSGVSSAAIDYWKENMTAININTECGIGCSDKVDFRCYSIDLHLIFCSHPNHRKVYDVQQKLSMLKEQWNGLNRKNKKIVMNGQAKKRLSCTVCADGRCRVTDFFSHIAGKRHLMNVAWKGVKVCEESVNAWIDRFRRLNGEDHSTIESEDDDSEEESEDEDEGEEEKGDNAKPIDNSTVESEDEESEGEKEKEENGDTLMADTQSTIKSEDGESEEDEDDE